MKIQNYFFSKIFILLAILIFAVNLSACGKEADLPPDEVDLNSGVEETGKVIDITDLDSKTATTTPGDVLYLKFAGVLKEGHQWDFISPTSGDYIMLKDHKFNKTPDEQKPEVENYTNEWWLKIEKTGTFDLQFNYNDYSNWGKKSISGLKPDKIFKLKVISE